MGNGNWYVVYLRVVSIFIGVNWGQLEVLCAMNYYQIGVTFYTSWKLDFDS